MAETVEQLIDQNLQRTQILLISIDKAEERIAQVMEFTAGLQTEATSAHEGMQNSFSALGEQLGKTGEELDGQVTNSRESLDQVRSEADELRTRIESLLEKVKSDADGIKTRQEEMLTLIGQESEETKSSLGEFHGQIQEYESVLESSLAEARTQIGEFREFVGTVREDFQAKKETLETEFDEFENAVKARLDELVAGFSGLISLANSRVETLQNHLESVSTQSLESLNSKFNGETLPHLTGGAEKLADSLEFLGDAGEAAHDLLGGKVGDIVDKVGDVIGVIDDIKEPLKLINTVLG